MTTRQGIRLPPDFTVVRTFMSVLRFRRRRGWLRCRLSDDLRRFTAAGFQIRAEVHRNLLSMSNASPADDAAHGPARVAAPSYPGNRRPPDFKFELIFMTLSFQR